MAGKSKRSPRATAVFGLSLAASALLAVTPAAAVTSDVFTYDAAQVGYLSINALDLAPMTSDAAGEYFGNPSPAYLSAGPLGGCFVTGVNLPQGALIGSVQSFVRSDEQSDVLIGLYRTEHATGVGETLVQDTVTDDSDALVSLTSTVPGPLRQVKNGVYSYGLMVCIGGSGTLFQSARIRYTYRNAGD